MTHPQWLAALCTHALCSMKFVFNKCFLLYVSIDLQELQDASVEHLPSQQMRYAARTRGNYAQLLHNMSACSLRAPAGSQRESATTATPHAQSIQGIEPSLAVAEVPASPSSQAASEYSVSRVYLREPLPGITELEDHRTEAGKPAAMSAGLDFRKRHQTL
jgi:hypothetical protein